MDLDGVSSNQSALAPQTLDVQLKLLARLVIDVIKRDRAKKGMVETKSPTSSKPLMSLEVTTQTN